MIKYKKDSLSRLKLRATVAPDIPAYNVMSSKGENDDIKFFSYRPYEMLLMILSEDGIFVEFESLFPKVVNNYPKYIDDDISIVKGIPFLESVETGGEIKLFLQNDRYILIFDECDDAIMKVCEDDICFYASTEKIVAIECRMYENEC